MKRDDDDRDQRPPVNPASSPFGHLFLTPGGSPELYKTRNGIPLMRMARSVGQ